MLCAKCLPAWVYVDCMYACCPRDAGEGAGFPGTGITKDRAVRVHVGAGSQIWAGAASAFNCALVSPSPTFVYSLCVCAFILCILVFITVWALG